MKTKFTRIISTPHLTPSVFRDLSAQPPASVFNADALESTFFNSLSACSKSLTFIAPSSLETGAREVWEGLIERTTPDESDGSFQCSALIP